jgi:hypothetical protein
MISIHKVDLKDKADVMRFIQLPFDLYAGHPQWVPPFIADVKTMLNPDKHPYYEHSDAEFFVAKGWGHCGEDCCAGEQTL